MDHPDDIYNKLLLLMTNYFFQLIRFIINALFCQVPIAPIFLGLIFIFVCSNGRISSTFIVQIYEYLYDNNYMDHCPSFCKCIDPLPLLHISSCHGPNKLYPLYAMLVYLQLIIRNCGILGWIWGLSLEGVRKVNILNYWEVLG